MKILVLFLLFAVQANCFAVEEVDIVAVGAWSESVTGLQDKDTVRGAHHPVLRARLSLCKSPKLHVLALYLEIQECAPSWGGDVEVYCDLITLRNFLEFRTTNGQPLPPKPSAGSGPGPKVGWVSLPCDSTVRLLIARYDSFGLAGPNDYTVSGRLVVDPPKDHAGLDVWQGVLKLPEITVVPRSL